MIRNIGTSILAAESPEIIAQIALSYLDKLVPCISLTVSLFEHDYRESVLLAGLNTVSKPGERSQVTPSPILDDLLSGRSIILRKPGMAANASEGFRTALEIEGQALMISPLIVHGKTIGAVNLISEREHAFSKDEEEIVEQVSDSVALAIHNWQLLETEQKARREADTLSEVASNINASLGKKELLDLILTQLKRVLPYDSASILQYQDGKMVVTAQKGLNGAAQAFLSPLDPLPDNIARLAEERTPQIIPDTLEDPNWITFPVAEKIRCWMGVPLIAKDSFVGLLMLDKWEPNFYSPQSAMLALAFANHAAMTIENARLIHDSQQQSLMLERRVRMRTRDLAVLYDITAVTSEFLDLPTLLKIVISRISVAMNCPTVTIHTLDESGKEFHLVGHQGVSPVMVNYSKKLSTDHPLIRQLYQQGEPLILSNLPSSQVISKIPLRSKLLHSATVPIRSKGKILGALGVAREQEPPFSREDVALLSSIADHIGIAIENDLLQKQAANAVIAEERERLARDLHDSITQSLFGLTLFAATARELVQNESLDEAKQYLDEITTTANQTHKEMRILLYELRPSVLAKEGLIGALRERIKTVEQRIGIQGQVTSNLSQSLPSSVEGALFKVANEALNNTLKHAKATKVLVSIFTKDQQIRLEVKDNGIGFDMNAAELGSGMGLLNMQQRMLAIGGVLSCHSTPGEGTMIVAAAKLAT
ncbi:MAG: GAF domain-containing sensor histidine kinase [Candidatus Promineifilaceae bacterium]|nr:GAF domain-containing sensor histidine kinase [Candidatus Promineifilaceae bacterium]